MLDTFSHAGRLGVSIFVFFFNMVPAFEKLPDLHHFEDDPGLVAEHPGRSQPVLLSSSILLHPHKLLELRDQVEHLGRGRGWRRGGEEEQEEGEALEEEREAGGSSHGRTLLVPLTVLSCDGNL